MPSLIFLLSKAIFTAVMAASSPLCPCCPPILSKACYDCHSNNTTYPWYASLQPVAWWLGDHIEHGKKELNFSEFGNYAPRKQYRKLEEVIEEVEADKMPLPSYTLIHRDARLKDNERQILINWARDQRQVMAGMYPPDSLARK